MSDIFGSENGLGAGIYREAVKAVKEYVDAIPPQDGSAETTVYQPGVGAAPATTVQKKLREVVSLGDTAADSTGADDSTAAVAAARASAELVFAPAGTYRAEGQIDGLHGTAEIISGGARVRLPASPRRGNLISAVLSKLSQVSHQNGMVISVDDSIGEGYYATEIKNSWLNLFQRMMNCRTAPGGEPEVTNMMDPARYGLTYTGAIAAGTAGPIGRSVVMQPGAKMTFSGRYQYVDPVYEQTPGGGVITLSRNGLVYRTIDTNGALTHDKCVFPSSAGFGADGDVYEFAVSGAPVEITGLWRLVNADAPAVLVSRIALSGSSTALHSQDEKIASAIRHAKSLNAAARPIVIIGLGINNTNTIDPAVGTTPELYQEHLEKMFARWINAGAYVVVRGLIYPSAAWANARGVFGAYVAAQSRACETYGVPLFDMNDIEWEANGKLFDGLHPNDAGNVAMLDRILDGMASPSFNPAGGTQGHRLREYTPTLKWLTSGLEAGTVGAATVRWTRNGPFCRVIGNLTGIQPSANLASGALCIGLPQKSGVMRCTGRIASATGLTTTGSAWTIQTTGVSEVAIVRSVNAAAGGFAEVTAIAAGSSIDFEIEYLVEE